MGAPARGAARDEDKETLEAKLNNLDERARGKSALLERPRVDTEPVLSIRCSP